MHGSPRLFTTILAVHRAYQTSQMYREVKFRGSLIADGSLRRLPQEEVFEQVGAVL